MYIEILGKACNNIPEAVNKLAVSAAWTILVKLGEINMTSLTWYLDIKLKIYTSMHL
jgi:hypothetical protein